MTTKNENFATNLSILLTYKGITAVQLSKQLGVSYPTVNSWKNGTSLPKGDRIVAVAGVLGVPVTVLEGTGIVTALNTAIGDGNAA